VESLRSMNNANVMSGVFDQSTLSSMNNTEDIRTVAERYRLVSLMGRGGMGSVHEAEDMTLFHRKVVLKIMETNLSDLYGGKPNLKIFNREAEVLSRIEHPGLPYVYDWFTEDDRAFMVMEYIEGKTLRNIMEDKEKDITEEQIIHMGIAIAEILRFLHRHRPKVIFRDLKPSNVIIQIDGKVKLVDYGISRAFSGEKKTTALISQRTMGFAPPEQFDENGIIDERSDIYSLGALLYYMATGIEPTLESLFSFPPINSVREDLSQSLENLIMRCLSYKKSERYRNMGQVINDLKKLKLGLKICNTEERKNREYLTISGLVALGAITAASFVGKITEKCKAPLTIKSDPEPFSMVPHDINRITIRFSAPMDTESVAKSMEINHRPPGGLKWSENDTICEVKVVGPPLPDNFEGLLIRINDGEAKDKTGRPLTGKNNPQYKFHEDYLGIVVKTGEMKV
jgi:serine/threonine protein kinase